MSIKTHRVIHFLSPLDSSPPSHLFLFMPNFTPPFFYLFLFKSNLPPPICFYSNPIYPPHFFYVPPPTSHPQFAPHFFYVPPPTSHPQFAPHLFFYPNPSLPLFPLHYCWKSDFQQYSNLKILRIIYFHKFQFRRILLILHHP